MNIEDVLKQSKPFENIYQKMLVNLMYTNAWMKREQKDFFDNYGITAQQYNILRILRGAKQAISTSEIRSRMIDKMSDTSRIVDRLIKKDLVKKSSCSEDLRKIDVLLTEVGNNLLVELDGKLDEWLLSYSNLTQGEAEQLSNLLDKMRK